MKSCKVSSRNVEARTNGSERIMVIGIISEFVNQIAEIVKRHSVRRKDLLALKGGRPEVVKNKLTRRICRQVRPRYHGTSEDETDRCETLENSRLYHQ